MNKRTFITITLEIQLAGASVFLFKSYFQEAKNTAITKLSEDTHIYAKQVLIKQTSDVIFSRVKT